MMDDNDLPVKKKAGPTNWEIVKLTLRLSLALGGGGALLLGGGAAMVNYLLTIEHAWWKSMINGGLLGLGVAFLLVATGLRHKRHEIHRAVLSALGGVMWGAAVTLFLVSLSVALIGANIGGIIGVMWIGRPRG
ncbi:MAG TPA: hypothetical protein VLL52_20345 [Anaerolineae bacterium]|nr:hypothetical protein [Anaerolineae bacterium]